MSTETTPYAGPHADSGPVEPPDPEWSRASPRCCSDFPSGTSVGSAWDATVTGSNNHWTAKNLGWNGTIAPGASVSFGFNGTGSGAPTGCKLNDNPCDGGSVPGDNAPSAPGTPSAGDITDTSAKLSWSAATDDQGIKNYDVLRDGAVTGTTHTDTGLTAGTDYSYTVRAHDTADQTGPVSASLKVRTTGGAARHPARVTKCLRLLRRTCTARVRNVPTSHDGRTGDGRPGRAAPVPADAGATRARWRGRRAPAGSDGLKPR